MTTADEPLNGASASPNGSPPESTAAAMRRRRESSISDTTLSEVRQDLTELATTMGAVSLSLAALQREAGLQTQRMGESQAEAARRMTSLLDSAKTSFVATERQIESYGDKIGRQLKDMAAESTKRAGQERWLHRAFALSMLTVCLLGGWAGWSLKEWRVEKAATEDKTFVSKMQRFNVYLFNNHRKVTEKYWQDFLSWDAKNGFKD